MRELNGLVERQVCVKMKLYTAFITKIDRNKKPVSNHIIQEVDIL